MERTPGGALSADESKLLRAIVSAWPREREGVAVEGNAAAVGREAGFDTERSVAVARSLGRGGLLAVREMSGVVMVRPTPAAFGEARKSGGVFRARAWLRGRRA